MVYEPGQVRNIFPYLDFDPKWFILGGPADGNEAQLFKEKYQSVSVIGLEPNREAFRYQTEVGFPGVLLPYAIGDYNGRGSFLPCTIRGGGLRDNGNYEVDVVTLDALHESHGPFEDAVLWLDIEGHEMEALRGADLLLREKRIRVMNLEIIENRRGITTLFDSFASYLNDRGYEYAGHWNANALSAGPDARYRRDTVWRCK